MPSSAATVAKAREIYCSTQAQALRREGRAHQWRRVSLLGKVAEIVGESLRKGAQCHIEGNGAYLDGNDLQALREVSQPGRPGCGG
ncbi:hypothetical protein FGL97_01085 [Pseudomonas putida]|nr:hypothetical protein [Pseudomonas putida]NVN66840.1 hypothetical protein [Pseudomonas putida]